MRATWLMTLCTCTTLTFMNYPVRAAAPETPAGGDAKRGEYLVEIGGCNHCHTPLKMGPKGPEPDFTRRLSGHPADLVMPPPPKPSAPWLWTAAATNTAFAGPWGISY